MDPENHPEACRRARSWARCCVLCALAVRLLISCFALMQAKRAVCGGAGGVSNPLPQGNQIFSIGFDKDKSMDGL